MYGASHVGLESACAWCDMVGERGGVLLHACVV